MPPALPDLARDLRAFAAQAMTLAGKIDPAPKKKTLRHRVIEVVKSRDNKPAKGAILASLCACEYSANFRRLLAKMTKEGVLQSEESGYYLSSSTVS